MAKVKVLKSKVKITRPKFMLHSERSSHKKCTCQILKPYLYYLSGSEDMAKVKVFVHTHANANTNARGTTTGL